MMQLRDLPTSSGAVSRLMDEELRQRVGPYLGSVPWEAKGDKTAQIHANVARQRERRGLAISALSTLDPLRSDHMNCVDATAHARAQLDKAQLQRKDLLGSTQAWHDAVARQEQAESALRRAELALYQSCWVAADVACAQELLDAAEALTRATLTEYSGGRHRLGGIAALRAIMATRCRLNAMVGGDQPPVDDLASWLADEMTAANAARQAVLDAPEPDEPDWLG
ncbi:MAG: hypothetical protein ABMA00_21130 [Gemmatimonas sp.]